MMKALPLLLLLASPTAAWDFSASRLCAVTHVSENLALEMTYDPSTALYTIGVQRPEAWTPAPIFGLAFKGARDLTIRTDRHAYSDAGRTVTVTDQDFGIVLDGLQFNETATAFLGDQAEQVSLDGAAPAIEAFRACIETPSV